MAFRLLFLRRSVLSLALFCVKSSLQLRLLLVRPLSKIWSAPAGGRCLTLQSSPKDCRLHFLCYAFKSYVPYLLSSVLLTDSAAVIKDLVGSGRWQMFDVTILV